MPAVCRQLCDLSPLPLMCSLPSQHKWKKYFPSSWWSCARFNATSAHSYLFMLQRKDFNHQRANIKAICLSHWCQLSLCFEDKGLSWEIIVRYFWFFLVKINSWARRFFLGIQTLYLQRSQILSIFVFPLQISKHNKWQKCVRVLTSSARCAVLWLWALCRLVANIIGVGREFQFGRKRWNSNNIGRLEDKTKYGFTGEQ